METIRMRKNNISVVIPTFNGETLLSMYLPPLIETLKNSPSINEYEIIVVDDASEDNTVGFLTKEYPFVIILKNEKNSGFSKTINKGIFAAKCNLVLLLNNDMVVASDFFEKTIPFFEKEDTFGIFSQIRDTNGEKVIEGNKLPIFKHGKLHYQDDLNSASGYSLYLCGGNTLIDREKIREIEGFNELFSPFYFEDFDLSIVAWKKGWKCYYTDQTFCKHCHSITIKKHFTQEYVQHIFLRNKLLFNYLHSGKIDSLRLFMGIFCKMILSILFPSKSKRTFRKSAQAFFCIYPQAHEKKRERNKEQLISLKKICADYFNISL